MKNSLQLAIVLGMIIAFGYGFDIATKGGEKLSMEFLTPQGTEDYRVRFSMELSSNLKYLDTATTICFRNDIIDSAGNPKAFGVQFLCALSECNVNYYINSYLLGSSFEEGEWQGLGTDFSPYNRGTYIAGNGLSPDTTYKFTEAQFNATGLPADDSVELECFVNYHGNYYNNNNLVGHIDV